MDDSARHHHADWFAPGSPAHAALLRLAVLPWLGQRDARSQHCLLVGGRTDVSALCGVEGLASALMRCLRLELTFVYLTTVIAKSTGLLLAVEADGDALATSRLRITAHMFIALRHFVYRTFADVPLATRTTVQSSTGDGGSVPFGFFEFAAGTQGADLDALKARWKALTPQEKKRFNESAKASGACMPSVRWLLHSSHNDALVARTCPPDFAKDVWHAADKKRLAEQRTSKTAQAFVDIPLIGSALGTRGGGAAFALYCTLLGLLRPLCTALQARFAHGFTACALLKGVRLEAVQGAAALYKTWGFDAITQAGRWIMTPDEELEDDCIPMIRLLRPEDICLAGPAPPHVVSISSAPPSGVEPTIAVTAADTAVLTACAQALVAQDTFYRTVRYVDAARVDAPFADLPPLPDWTPADSLAVLHASARALLADGLVPFAQRFGGRHVPDVTFRCRGLALLAARLQCVLRAFLLCTDGAAPPTWEGQLLAFHAAAGRLCAGAPPAMHTSIEDALTTTLPTTWEDVKTLPPPVNLALRLSFVLRLKELSTVAAARVDAAVAARGAELEAEWAARDAAFAEARAALVVERPPLEADFVAAAAALASDAARHAAQRRTSRRVAHLAVTK
jgi:hypothetical protein